MMARRSGSGILARAAISPSARPQPAQRPDRRSIVQRLMEREEMAPTDPL